MVETWAQLRGVPRCYHVRRIPLDARAGERSSAAGEHALQALLPCARDHARPREAPDAAQGLCTRRRPLGVAALPWYCAQPGTGDVGPARPRADGGDLPRERPRRERDDGARVGTWAVARTCDRTPGEPGSVPLEAPVHLPARCSSDGLPEGMTWCAGEPPVTDRAGLCAQLCALEVAARVLRAVAPAAPEDAEGGSAQRPVPPADTAGALLVGSVGGQGLPMLQAAAVQLHATWGTGETRPPQKAALGGGERHRRGQPAGAGRAGGTAGGAGRGAGAPAAGRHGGRGAQSPAGPASGPRGADAAGGQGGPQRRRGAPGAPAAHTFGRPAGWGPRPVASGDPALDAVDAHDVCPRPQARQELPRDRGPCRVRGRLPGGHALGATAVARASARSGGRRQRRPATAPPPAAAPAVGPGDARPRHHVLPQPPALEVVRRRPGCGRARWDRRGGVGGRVCGPAPDGRRRPALAPARGRGHAGVALAPKAP